MENFPCCKVVKKYYEKCGVEVEFVDNELKLLFVAYIDKSGLLIIVVSQSA